MSTLSALYPTLLDITKRLDRNGNIDLIAEVLSQTNEILDDMVWKEGNLVTGHRGTVRTGIPTPTWRKLYGFVQPGKSTTAQITDNCGMLEAYSEIDVDLAKLNGNSDSFRTSEDKAQVEGMGQEIASTIFYGDESTEPEAFTGLAPRFNDQSAENGCNIITSAATPDSSDNTSMWLVVWGDNVHGIYPKGSKAGLSMKDLGEQTKTDSNGGLMQVLRSHYKWDVGLHVKDWRYVVRINFDQEDLVKNAATGPDLIDLMCQAIDCIPNINAGRAVFYCNKKTRSYFRRQAFNKFTSMITVEQVARANGLLMRVPMFDGIPIRRCDAILSTESGL